MRAQHFDRIGWIDLDHILKIGDVRRLSPDGWQFEYTLAFQNKPHSVGWMYGQRDALDKLHAELVAAWRGDAEVAP